MMQQLDKKKTLDILMEKKEECSKKGDWPTVVALQSVIADIIAGDADVSIW